MSQLSLIHFNDVYRVTPQKLKSGTIDSTQFAALVHDLRDAGSKQGLVLFSGDAFSPSVESSITQGRHMVPVLNEIAPDVALTGNHEFDFGFPHLTTLVQECKFPWLLSNVIDTRTNKVPESLHEYQVFERAGVRIGVIGLVERDWIATVPSWPPTFKFIDMVQVGMCLSKRLRDPNGEQKCDIIVALTHSRLPNDIKLAKDLFALSSSAQSLTPITEQHGVDILLGGHDHFYYISRGVDAWQGCDTAEQILGAEDDNEDVLVIKSGTDFRELSQIVLELEDAPYAIRRKTIKRITGKRFATQPGSRSSSKLQLELASILGPTSTSLNGPIAKCEIELDLRSEFIRTAETASGNWFADIVRRMYNDALGPAKDGGIVLLTSGTLRGDSVYGPGNLTVGDLIGILPFKDPLVMLELDGAAIWEALEAGLQRWPAQEGRFPILSGFRVVWDSRKLPGERVISVHHSITGRGLKEIRKTKSGRKYKLITRRFLAQGHDGYTMLKGCKCTVDNQINEKISNVVGKYLLGSKFDNQMKHLTDNSVSQDLSSLNLCKSKIQHRYQTRAQICWRQLTKKAIQSMVFFTQIGHALDMDARLHMRGEEMHDALARYDEEGLLVIHPIVDGRLVDVGRPPCESPPINANI